MSDGGAMSWFGVAMVAVVIAIALAIVFLFFLHIHSKWYLRRHLTSYSNHDINNPISGNAVAGGLDVSILRSLPVVSFKFGDYKDGMECSVCLCEVSEGEKARLLPNCNHGFHLECIDMWFRSHSTCPLCRTTVSPAPVSGHAPPETTMGIPTNVLFWGSDDQVNAGRARVEDGSTSTSTSSTSSSTTSSSSPAAGAREEDAGGKIVIDVARQNGVAAEESPRSPAARLKSFRKLFKREGRSMAWSTREEGEEDVEQGMAKL